MARFTVPTIVSLPLAGACALLLAPAGCIFGEDTPNNGSGTPACGLFTECRDADGCCPAACNERTDDDCRSVCGDGVVSPDEICEPLITCPISCDDGDPCTRDGFAGTLESCTLACIHTEVTWCEAGDGCCVPGCGAPGDTDCPH